MDFAMNEEPQPRSVSSYASGVFGESTIGMVSSIVTTRSRGRRAFKSVVLLLSVAGFFYQSVTYLLHVFEYPTVMGIDIKRPQDFIVPAYTFCSNNGMKRNVFCSLYPDRCYEPSEHFCLKWRSYCGTNKTLIPKKEYYEVEDTMSFEDILKHGHHLEDIIVPNKTIITGDIKGPYIRTKDETKGAMICYNLHSVAETNEIPLRREGDEFSFFREPIDILTFYIEEDEMLIPGNLPGVLFTVHSPYKAVNPFNKGTFMIPGRNYKIYVNMEEEVLLQEPFQPTCIDYIEMWEANNRTGPRIQECRPNSARATTTCSICDARTDLGQEKNERFYFVEAEMCMFKCFFETSMKCFNCCMPDVIYPNSEKICKNSDMAISHCTKEDFRKFDKCIADCKDDCRLTKYSFDEFERYEVDHDETDDPLESRRYITIEIYLEDSEIMILQHSPKYINVEVFSAIGGFIGVWLGISFMDVIDVFASAFSVCRYTVRKYQRH